MKNGENKYFIIKANNKCVRVFNNFKPTIGNEGLHQDSNDNGVRIVNFATSKNLALRAPCSHTETS